MWPVHILPTCPGNPERPGHHILTQHPNFNSQKRPEKVFTGSEFEHISAALQFPTLRPGCLRVSASCVILGKLFAVAHPWCPYLQKGVILILSLVERTETVKST